MRIINPTGLIVPTLWHCVVESPIQRYWARAHEIEIFVSDEDKILLDDSLTSVATAIAPQPRSSNERISSSEKSSSMNGGNELVIGKLS
jgi:hypothetical protein